MVQKWNPGRLQMRGKKELRRNCLRRPYLLYQISKTLTKIVQMAENHTYRASWGARYDQRNQKLWRIQYKLSARLSFHRGIRQQS